uniref:Uncharacterized protein n=1 Tax=Cannabis sativa TaxID=3483 RepID=A0A803NK85_CANSA
MSNWEIITLVQLLELDQSSYKMDGGRVTMLEHVRHVPKIKGNLISMAMLDQDGYSVKVGNGSVRVTKGSMVVMKATVMNGTYVFYGGVKILSKHGVFGKYKIQQMGLCRAVVVDLGEGRVLGLCLAIGVPNQRR